MPMRLNDEERRLWVMNDETLYRRWKATGERLWNYVRENRKSIDHHINTILNPERSRR